MKTTSAKTGKEGIPTLLLKSWPYNLRMLALITLMLSMGWSGLNRFASPYLRDNGVNVVWIGLFFSVSSAVGALAAPVGGILADIWGRRPLLVLGRALTLSGWLGMLVARGRAGLLISAALIGLGWMASSGLRAIIAESASPGRRASAFALNGVMDNISAIIVPLVVGLLSERLGLRSILIAMLIPYSLGVLLTTRLRETLTRNAGTGPEPSLLSGLAFMISHEGRGAMLMGIIWALTGVSVGLTQPLWGLYITDRYGVGYSGVGVLSAAMSAGAVLGQLVGGRAADRFGYSKLMVASLCLTSSLWLAMPSAASPWLFSSLVTVSNLGGWLAAPSWEALGADAAEKRVRGAVSGIYTGLFSIGMAIGSGGFGLVYRRSPALPFYILLANDLTMLALVLFGMRAGLRGFSRRVANEE